MIVYVLLFLMVLFIILGCIKCYKAEPEQCKYGILRLPRSAAILGSLAIISAYFAMVTGVSGDLLVDLSKVNGESAALVCYEEVDTVELQREGLDTQIQYRDNAGVINDKTVPSQHILTLNPNSKSVCFCTIEPKALKYAWMIPPSKQIEVVVLGTEEDVLAYFGEDTPVQIIKVLQKAEK